MSTLLPEADTDRFRFTKPKPDILDRVRQSRVTRVLTILGPKEVRKDYPDELKWIDIVWNITNEGLVRDNKGEYVVAKGYPNILSLSNLVDIHIDGRTLQEIFSDTDHTKTVFSDKNFVYFIGTIQDINSPLIISTHPEKFSEIPGNGGVVKYFTDEENVFVLITGKFSLVTTDARNFTFLEELGYTRDGSNIYYLGSKVSSDIANFTFIGGGFTKDSNSIYLDGYKLFTGNTDNINKLESIGGSYYADNGGNVYYHKKYPAHKAAIIRINDINASSFSPVKNNKQNLWTDGKNDYINGGKVTYYRGSSGKVLYSYSGLDEFSQDEVYEVQQDDQERVLAMHPHLKGQNP